MVAKFLIVDDRLIVGFSVKYHHELLPENYTSVSGGGIFHIDKANERVILFGSSHDYKQATKEVILSALRDALLSPSLFGYKFYISHKDWLPEAAKECAARETPDYIYEE